MKILTRKQFMEMPAGTVYSYYEPCIFHGLIVKDSEPKEQGPDFVVSGIIGAIECNNSDEFIDKCHEMEQGGSVPMDFEYSGREGMFDDKQLFAVYEKADVEKLIKRLQDTI